jgi:exosome complex RNA-binding protein Rrp42 (RNase PH superfamily)
LTGKFVILFICHNFIPSSSSAVKGVDEKATQERNNLMATGLQHILSSSFDLKQLCIVKGKHCWALYVDVLILESDGNTLDAAVMTARAALSSTKLPGVSVEEDAEAESIELSSDPNDSKSIDCSNLPLTITLCQIDSTAYFVDPTKSEETCARAILTVAVNPSGTISFMHKSAGGSIEASILADMIGVAQSTASTLFSQF